ncbi:hypothetical protein FACS1894176_05050 [Bacteroidia bacterium]|nr:hypothetical protein FACS1894176_05050 [Bacteroidia bacterium]
MQYVLLSTIYKKYSFKRDEQITLYEQSQPNHRWEDVSIREELENTAQKNYK